MALKGSRAASRRSRPVLVDVLLIAVVIVAVGFAPWVLLREDDAPPAASTPAAETECDLMQPRGLRPADWFAADGSTALSEDEAGSIALVMGARASLDPEDTDARKVSDALASIYSRQPGPPLTNDQHVALSRLDDEARGNCS